MLVNNIVTWSAAFDTMRIEPYPRALGATHCLQVEGEAATLEDTIMYLGEDEGEDEGEGEGEDEGEG